MCVCRCSKVQSLLQRRRLNRVVTLSGKNNTMIKFNNNYESTSMLIVVK